MPSWRRHVTDWGGDCTTALIGLKFPLGQAEAHTRQSWRICSRNVQASMLDRLVELFCKGQNVLVLGLVFSPKNEIPILGGLSSATCNINNQNDPLNIRSKTPNWPNQAILDTSDSKAQQNVKKLRASEKRCSSKFSVGTNSTWWSSPQLCGALPGSPSPKRDATARTWRAKCTNNYFNRIPAKQSSEPNQNTRETNGTTN